MMGFTKEDKVSKRNQKLWSKAFSVGVPYRKRFAVNSILLDGSSCKFVIFPSFIFFRILGTILPIFCQSHFQTQ